MLLSPDFIASDSCFKVEEAIKRLIGEFTRIIPILLRPAYWKNGIFDRLQVLPSNGKPITLWSNKDAAFLDVVTALLETIKDIQNFSSKIWPKQEYQYHEGSVLFSLNESDNASIPISIYYFQKLAKASPNREMIASLMRSIFQKHSLSFMYSVSNQAKEISYEHIEPHYITYVNGQFYLVGYSNKREHFLEFRINYIVPGSIKVEAYYITPNRGPQPITFRYWIEADFAQHSLTQRWLTSLVEKEEVIQIANGIEKKRILIKATAYNEFRIVQQLLKYSTNVELIDPPYLREHLCKIIKQMYSLYHQ